MRTKASLRRVGDLALKVSVGGAMLGLAILALCAGFLVQG
jgi:hypothetical protein